jgi:hypothetical protein
VGTRGLVCPVSRVWIVRIANSSPAECIHVSAWIMGDCSAFVAILGPRRIRALMVFRRRPQQAVPQSLSASKAKCRCKACTHMLIVERTELQTCQHNSRLGRGIWEGRLSKVGCHLHSDDHIQIEISCG